jgi:hypothetical protein
MISLSIQYLKAEFDVALTARVIYFPNEAFSFMIGEQKGWIYQR